MLNPPEFIAYVPTPVEVPIFNTQEVQLMYVLELEEKETFVEKSVTPPLVSSAFQFFPSHHFVIHQSLHIFVTEG